MGSRAVTCVWLVAVVQLGALLVVSVVQQLHMTELTHSNLQLKLMLLDIIKGQPDYIPSDTAMEAVFRDTEGGDWQRHGDTERTRHERQLGYDAILSDILRAQETAIASHCSNANKTCVQGPKGESGAAGDKGLAGPRGPRGARGQKGEEGPTGVKGSPGLTGSDGPQGPGGDVGPTGAAGPQGDVGGDGHKGDTGLRGEAGAAGPQGEAGERGESGATGPAGPKGAAGGRGAKGELGGAGPRGPRGQPGPRGQAALMLAAGCTCLKAPHIHDLPAERAVQLGTPLQLTCQADGNPPPTVTWSGRQSHVLRIDHVLVGDLDPYTCTATNPFGTDSRNVTLHTERGANV